MSVADGVKTWLFSVAVKKAVQNICKVVLAWITSAGILSILEANGIKIELDQTKLEVCMTALITGAYEIGRNYLKQKYPKLNII